MFWGEPVRGEPILTMVGAADHALVSRSFSTVSHVLDYDRDPAAAHGGDYLRQDPAGTNQDFVVPWTQNPHAEQVAVWIAFQAQDLAGATSAPVLDVTLQTVVGAAIDNPGGGPGVRLSEAAGSLGAALGYAWRGVTRIYPIRHVSLVRVIPTPAAGSYPTRARAMQYGTAAGSSQRVELRFQTTDVRILRVDVQEIPRGVLVV
jgi:hypothetical protein